MKAALTAGGFVAAAIVLLIGAIVAAALNLVLNGYHRECGIWRNCVPLMCSPKPQSWAPPAPRLAPRSLPAPKRASASPAARPRGADPWGCGPLQPEPYRVQGDYHDLGFRASCGVAHDWSDGQ